MSNDWWGFDAQLKTWIYLDRSITNNQPDYAHLPLIFVDCKSESTFEVSRVDWKEPRFIYEGRVLELHPNESLIALQRFKSKISKYQALVKPFAFNPKKQPDIGLEVYTYQSEPKSIQIEKLSPEQIRARYAKEYSDEAWSEIISYVALMNELEIRDQGKCNEHITRANLWHRYPNIRAMNDHGYGKEIEGITRTAYRLVCEIINLQNNHGAPLLHSRKY